MAGKAKPKSKKKQPTARSCDSEESCNIRFSNQRQGVEARVLWVDFQGEEREYARLQEELCVYTQQTYVTHPWRLRDAQTGQLLAEYVGPTATITLLPDGSTHIEPGLHRPPPVEVTDPRWGTYRRRGQALGIPILAFDCVSQAAVEVAEHVVTRMLADTDASIVQCMLDGGADIAIIGREQVTTDLPMYRHLRGVKCDNGGGDFDSATRGLGGNPGNPTTSCGEENLLMQGDTRYTHESILVHEFGHAVMDLGLQGSPLQAAILAAYKAARGSGRYDLNCYMMANESEYWAEGTQAWFDATVREDVTSGVNTREKLKEWDPGLAGIMALVYGDGSWRYPATAPGEFEPWDKSSSKRRRKAAAEDGKAAGERQQVVAPAGEGRQQQQGQQGQAADGDAITNPLLAGSTGGSSSSGGSSLRLVTRRKGGVAPKRTGGGGRGGAVAGAAQRRITRALARVMACCVGNQVIP